MKNFSFKGEHLVISMVVFLTSLIILSLVVIGSPTKNRKLRIDEQHRANIEMITFAITDYLRIKEANSLNLPEQIDEIYSSMNISGLDYKKIDESHFELCAEFNYQSGIEENLRYADRPIIIDKMSGIYRDNLTHDAGYDCLQFKIDTDSAGADKFISITQI